MSVTEMSPWLILTKGGPIMWPILLCSIFALAIVLEKLYFFVSIQEDVEELKKKVFDAVKSNQMKKAISLCEDAKSPAAVVMRAGLIKFGTSKEEMRQAMEDAAQCEIPRLEKRLSGLSTIGSITPLLGLLGTVTGMTASFHTIQVRSAALNPVTPGDIAGGIWEALLTTVVGLVVAIPTFVAYNYCLSRVNQFIREMEHAALELTQLLTHLSEG